MFYPILTVHLHFSNKVKRQCCVLQLFRKPYCCVDKKISKKIDLCENMVLSKTFDNIVVIGIYMEWDYLCVKSVQIRSFSGPYFPVFSPNTGKYRLEKTPYLDTFHALYCLLLGPFYPFFYQRRFKSFVNIIY